MFQKAPALPGILIKIHEWYQIRKLIFLANIIFQFPLKMTIWESILQIKRAPERFFTSYSNHSFEARIERNRIEQFRNLHTKLHRIGNPKVEVFIGIIIILNYFLVYFIYVCILQIFNSRLF